MLNQRRVGGRPTRRTGKSQDRDSSVAGQPARWPLLDIDDVLTLDPADYCYGSEPLRMRVLYPPTNADLLALEWVGLAGVDIRPDGTEGPLRAVICRVSAIRAAMRGRADG